MSNLAEDHEFEDETVAEALEKAQQNQQDDDDGFEIEVVDDTPEEDRDKPRRAEGAEPNVPDDDEVKSYSEGVQKRIKQLKFEYHEERRAKEEAARLQDEALRYAQQVKQENDRLLKQLQEGESVLVDQAKGRVTAELDKAKAAYKAAYETGDPDALLEAQEKLKLLLRLWKKLNKINKMMMMALRLRLLMILLKKIVISLDAQKVQSLMCLTMMK